MAILYWVGASSSYWNNSGNWSTSSGGSGGAGVPGTADTATFDGSYTGSGTCITDIAIDCYKIVITSFDGLLDFADSSYSHNIIDSCNFAGSTSAVDLGNCTLTVGGNFYCYTQGTWTYGTSHIRLTGSYNTHNCGKTNALYDLTIVNGATYLDFGVGIKIINKLIIENNAILICNNTDPPEEPGIIILKEAVVNGSLNGDAAITYSIWGDDASSPFLLSGTGTINIPIWFSTQGNDADVEIRVGSTCPIFTDECRIGLVSGSNEVHFNCSINNPDLEFQGDLYIDYNSTDSYWSKGTGTIIFSGTNDQIFTDNYGSILDDIEVNKSGGSLTLASDLYTDSFTGIDGDFDLAGYTVWSDGNVSINGSTGFRFHNGTDYDMNDGTFDLDGGILTLGGVNGTQLNIDNLNFNLASGITGSASYCNVLDSVCTYVTSAIDATDGTVLDQGGNSGWSFGADGLIVWEYWDGDSWEPLSGLVDDTGGFSVSGLQDVTFDPPSDWAKVAIDLETPLYYIRARISSALSNIPKLAQVFLNDVVEHHVHFPSSGTFTASNLNFIGTSPAGEPKWHGENSSAGTVTINASESNIAQNEIENTGGGSTTVNSTADITLSGLIANTEVRVYEAGTTTEVDGVENSGTSFTFSADVSSDVDIIIHHIEYVPIRIEGYTIPTINTTIPIQQQFDRNYDNP